jgi:sulfur dioxygenase
MSLIFRQLHDPKSSTYTYLLGDSVSREAVLIDPVFEQARRDAALVRELDLSLRYTLDTHVHADHVTAAWLLKQTLGSRICLSARANASGVDEPLEHGSRVHFGERYLEVRATPGHTDGCSSFVLDDESMVFTGDALLIRGAGRTDFQQGNAHTLYHSIVEQLFTLPDDCIVYPAHDYRGLICSSVGEEKRFNPRMGGTRSEHDFAGYMENLGLGHPKQMDVAVPANLLCGHVESAERALAPGWAPLNYTYAGVNEVEPDWVALNADQLQIIDVRDVNEYTGELGHIAAAVSIPLPELPGRLGDLDAHAATVTVCRSGGRSAQAVVMLERAGFEKVANLAGGMLAWREHGLPVA